MNLPQWANTRRKHAHWLVVCVCNWQMIILAKLPTSSYVAMHKIGRSVHSFLFLANQIFSEKTSVSLLQMLICPSYNGVEQTTILKVYFEKLNIHYKSGLFNSLNLYSHTPKPRIRTWQHKQEKKLKYFKAY
jgi:hypothetical protein